MRRSLPRERQLRDRRNELELVTTLLDAVIRVGFSNRGSAYRCVMSDYKKKEHRLTKGGSPVTLIQSLAAARRRRLVQNLVAVRRTALRSAQH